MRFFRLVADTITKVILNRNTFIVFAIASVFYLIFYSIPYSNQTITNVHCALVDMDQTPASRTLADDIAASPGIRIQLRSADLEEVKARFKRSEFDVFIVIPPGYARDIARAQPTAISIFSNGAYAVKGRAVNVAVRGIVGVENVKVALTHLTARGLDGRVAKRMSQLPPSFVSQDLYNNISGYGIFLVPVVALIIVQAMMFFGIGIALGGWLEKREPTTKHLWGNTTGFWAMLTGFFTIALTWTLLLEALGLWALEMPTLMNFWASIAAAIAFSLSISAAATALAFAMGTNRYAAGMVLCSAPAVFLTGLIYPMENFAAWVMPFAWLIPTTPACRAMVFASQEGATILQITPLLCVSLTQALVYSALARMICARKYRTSSEN